MKRYWQFQPLSSAFNVVPVSCSFSLLFLVSGSCCLLWLLLPCSLFLPLSVWFIKQIQLLFPSSLALFALSCGWPQSLYLCIFWGAQLVSIRCHSICLRSRYDLVPLLLSKNVRLIWFVPWLRPFIWPNIRIFQSNRHSINLQQQYLQYLNASMINESS